MTAASSGRLMPSVGSSWRSSPSPGTNLIRSSLSFSARRSSNDEFSAVGTPTNPNDTPTDGVRRTVSPGSGVNDVGNRNDSDRRVPAAPRGFANPHGCSRKARPVASMRAWTPSPIGSSNWKPPSQATKSRPGSTVFAAGTMVNDSFRAGATWRCCLPGWISRLIVCRASTSAFVTVLRVPGAGTRAVASHPDTNVSRRLLAMAPSAMPRPASTSSGEKITGALLIGRGS